MPTRRHRSQHAPTRALLPAAAYRGGRLAVDYANTAHLSMDSGDPLQSWEGLLSFLAATGVIAPDRERTLLEWQQTSAPVTQQFLHSAVRLRIAIREAFLAMTEGGTVREGAIDRINEVLAVTEGHDELAWVHGVWQVKFRAREERLEWLLAAIARSAAEIISEGEQAPLRRCANPACGRLFYDTSRTARRRWCSMSVCGNRSKVAAFARRHSSRSRQS